MSRNFFSDLDIQAYIDRELDSETEKQVGAFIKSDPKARRRFEELNLQKRLLKSWWVLQKAH